MSSTKNKLSYVHDNQRYTTTRYTPHTTTLLICRAFNAPQSNIL